jgi:hypothetical protein
MSGECVKTPVVMETSRHSITGNVAVPAGERLSDYANSADRTFFAVTEARIAPIAQPDRQRPLEFILVNRAEVGLITPGVVDERPPVDPAWNDSFGFALGVES